MAEYPRPNDNVIISGKIFRWFDLNLRLYIPGEVSQKRDYKIKFQNSSKSLNPDLPAVKFVGSCGKGSYVTSQAYFQYGDRNPDTLSFALSCVISLRNSKESERSGEWIHQWNATGLSL